MNVLLLTVRRQPNREATPGALYIGPNFECFTLEDPEIPDPNPATPHNEAKVPGRTAIPRGEYDLWLTWSPKFHRVMPEVMNVPGFSGVRIHWGATVADTAGCILTGKGRGKDVLKLSRAAFDALFEKISSAISSGVKCRIRIEA